MIRLSVTRGLDPTSVTITASVELAEGAPDIPGKLRTLVEQLAVVMATPTANGHSPAPNHPPAHTSSPPNGQGAETPATSKQVSFINSLRAKCGLRMADLAARIEEVCGPGATLKSLSKDQASALIEGLKADNPPAKAE